MDQEKLPEHIVISQLGSVGVITLNRPKALNALTLDMIRQIRFALNGWRNNDAIKAVYIDGEGDRAFCAGGDIKHFYRIGMDYRKGSVGFDVAMLFFKEEYELNEVIFSYDKPIISHMHGITMGGGYGIAGNAKYRLVAADTRFAMPEVKIGFFPDVGSMYHLTRVPNNVGLFLAASGYSILAGDMLDFGLAEFAMEKSDKNGLLHDLNEALLNQADSHDAVKVLLADKSSKSAQKRIFTDEQKNLLSNAFGKGNLSESLEELKNKPEFKDIVTEMNKNSPFSMVFAAAYFKNCLNKPFSEVIHNDFSICSAFAQGSEFYEGIRAAVIDKDRSPTWLNSDVLSVSNDQIEGYLSQIRINN